MVAVVACAAQVEALLHSVADAPVHLMRTSDKETALLAVARIEAEVTELKLRLLASAADVAEQHAARDAGAWLAHATHLDHRTARAELRLAEALDGKHPITGTGMREGLVNVAQARVIVTAVDELPVEYRDRAEAHLVELAQTLDPHDLKIAGAKILEVVAPDIAEAEEGKALEREEQRARIKCSMRFRPMGDGTTRITALVPDAVAGRLTTYLDAYTSPRKQEGSLSGEEDRIPRHRLLGQAFCSLLEHLDPATLPDHGGDATTIIVTTTLDALRADLAAASLDTGELVSASQARRLACTAKIIPAVLGTNSEVLDLGRAARLYNAPQRKALRLRDKCCRAEGCSIPATWCEAHHLNPWSQGGRTDLTTGVLFCSHHHHRAHDTRFEMTKLASGDYRFHRRT
jgi:hypothetical protein